MTLLETFENNPTTTINDSGGISDSDTSVTVASATGWPASGQYRIKIESEIMLVTGGQGTTTWTIVRSQDGTSAAAHADGTAIKQPLTRDSLKNIIDQRAGQSGCLEREAMNFPSLEGADGTQPEWWEEADGNATLTEEDIAGESITETWERALKVVVATGNSYAYQRYTYADQPRLKSGRQASAMYAVWSVSSAVARIRIQSSVGSLGVSKDTAAAGWTILTVDPVTLDGTYVEIRLEVDVGTAYFVPLTPRPREVRYRAKTTATVKTLTGIADEATWTDVDVTADTGSLACMANLMLRLNEGVSGFDLSLRLNGSGKSSTIYSTIDSSSVFSRVTALVLLDDAQIFEYNLDRFNGSSTLDFGVIELIGFWEWA